MDSCDKERTMWVTGTMDSSKKKLLSDVRNSYTLWSRVILTLNPTLWCAVKGRNCREKWSQRYLSWAWAPAAAVRTFRWPRFPPCYVWWRPGGSQTRWPSQWTPWPLRRAPPGARTGLRARLRPARTNPAAARTEEDRECRHRAKQFWSGEEEITELKSVQHYIDKLWHGNLLM